MNDMTRNLKVFLDTNELVDLILNRSQNKMNVNKIMSAIFKKDLEGYVSSHSLTDLFYVTRKELSLEDRRLFLKMLIDNLTILTESNNDFSKVLNEELFFDLEDGLQIQCAKEADIDFLITENIKDFEHAAVKALTAKEFLETNF